MSSDSVQEYSRAAAWEKEQEEFRDNGHTNPQPVLTLGLQWVLGKERIEMMERQKEKQALLDRQVKEWDEKGREEMLLKEKIRTELQRRKRLHQIPTRTLTVDEMRQMRLALVEKANDRRNRGRV